MLSYEQLVGFILSWMNRMRQNGAFALPIYTKYVENGAKGYLLSGKHINWMPGGYLNPFFPAIQSRGGASNGFEALSDHCWYVRKLMLLLNTTAIECPGIVQAAGIVIEELEKSRIFIRMEGPKGLSVFGLAPSVYRVTRDISTLRCNVCGHVISAETAHAHYGRAYPVVEGTAQVNTLQRRYARTTTLICIRMANWSVSMRENTRGCWSVVTEST